MYNIFIMQDKDVILLATNVIMFIVVTILQIDMNNVFYKVIKEKYIIAKKIIIFDVISQQHLNTNLIVYLTYIECIYKIKFLDVYYGP